MFKIGEFSKINRITIKTLRYYEKIGLLFPCKIDSESGYRYYSISQLNDIINILTLKRMGFSLAEIKNMNITNLDKEAINKKIEEIKKQLQDCNKMIFDLTRLRTKISGGKKMNEVKIKSLPEVIVASHRTIIKSYDDLFDVVPGIVGKEMQRLGCECRKPDYCFNIYHDHEYKTKDIDVEICEAVTQKKEDTSILKFKVLPAVKTAATIEHKGSYNSLGESYNKIFKWLKENNYKIRDNPRESFIDGIWNKENPDDWLTEIQVPIA